MTVGRSRVPDRIRAATDALALTGTERVLEIGCGSGQAALHLLGAHPQLQYVAVDRSARAARLTARRTASVAGEGRMRVIEAQACALPAHLHDADRFDVVFAVNVNVFWTAPDRAPAGVLADALRPGGRLVLIYQVPDASRVPYVRSRVMQSLDIPSLTAVSWTESEQLGSQLVVRALRR